MCVYLWLVCVLQSPAHLVSALPSERLGVQTLSADPAHEQDGFGLRGWCKVLEKCGTRLHMMCSLNRE